MTTKRDPIVTALRKLMRAIRNSTDASKQLEKALENLTRKDQK